MALIIKDRVKEITTTTGTGDVSLGGASATFDTFQSVMSNGDTTFYAIVHTASGTDEWEVGVGTWNTGNTLTRTTVYAGSNGTSAVNFSSGNKDIFMTYPASKAAVAGEDVTFADITATDITATGTVTLSGDPTSALQAATKEYVDTIAAAGIHYHTPVRVEAPSALTATYDNGTSGVGATLTNSGTQAALVIDGVTLSTSDRVLVYNQTNAAHNGVYTVTNTGSASTNWVLTRATDADSYGASDPDAMGEGDAYFVKEGDTGAGELYVMNTSGVITFGTTNITFTVIAETAVYSAGTGLTLTGTTFSTNQDISTSASPTFNNITVTGTVDGRDVATDGSKLDGIEAGATADQTAAEIKTAYESNSDTNAFTDAEQSKLSGIEAGATGDQTASEILTAIKTVDGAASGLDADLLDGQQGSYYLNTSTTFSGDVSGTYGAMVVADDSHNHVISNVDGLQTALDGKTTTSRTITAGNGLTGGGDFTANRTINVGAGSGITVTADAVSHADTSSQASVNNSNGTVIQDVTLDTYGHVTGLTSANLDGRYYTETEADSRFVNVTGDTMTGVLKLDSNQEYDNLANVAPSNAGQLRFDSGNNGMSIGLDDDTNSRIGWIQVGHNSNTYPSDSVQGTLRLNPHGGSVTINNQTAFHNGYHPNADKWTTARTLSLSGDASGSVSWDGSANATLSVTVANDSHTHDGRYYTESESDSRFVNVTGDTMTGTLRVSSGADIELHTSATDIGDIVWIDSSGEKHRLWDGGTGLNYRYRAGTSYKVFHDGYHPNADKWTTARTLSLSGDASGSVSWDGSANATLSVTVANNSHTHTVSNISDRPTNFSATVQTYTTIASGEWDLRTGSSVFAKQDSSGGPGTDGYWFVTGRRDTQGGYSGIFTPHGDGRAYVGYNSSGASNPVWATIWTSTTDGSGSGLDADLLDGVQGSSYLRSDATDTFTNLSGTSLTLGSGVVLQESTDRADLLQITSSTSGWGGLQIRNSSNEGRWSFMTDGTAAGIYDDENGDWHIYMNENAGVDLRYNGTNKLSTTSYGAVVKGDGGETLTIQDTGDTHYNATAYLYFKDSAGTAMGYLGKSTYGSYEMTLHAASGGDIVLFTSGGLKYSNGSNEYNIWHAANDGSGSGLDADTVDGIQASSFLRSDANDTASGVITLSSSARDTLNFSANSTDDNRGVAFNGRIALSADYNDGYLRLNNAQEFGNGIYTPANFRADGWVEAGSGIRHVDDTNTNVTFGTDTVTIIAGGQSEVTVNSTGVRLGDTGNGYFQPVSGNYGSIQIDGGAHGGWEGYSIGGRMVFMHDNSNVVGIYNDVDNEWLFYGSRNAETRMYYNGAEKIRTSSTGVTVTGTVAATSYTGDGSSLTGISAGATGGGSDEIFWENGQNVTSNYTITNGKNAMSAGPITINSGVTVTVGSGETWTVV